MNNIFRTKVKYIMIVLFFVFLFFFVGSLNKRKDLELKKDYVSSNTKIIKIINKKILECTKNIKDKTEQIVYLSHNLLLFERRNLQEVEREGYQIIKKINSDNGKRICYPEIKMSDREKEENINEILRNKMTALLERQECGEEISYIITYADTQYLSILYDISYGEENHTKSAITLQLETEEKISLDDLWLEFYDISKIFEESPIYFCENSQKELLKKKKPFNRTISILNWTGYYYLANNRIGIIWEDGLCIEAIFNWKKHINDIPKWILYEEDGKEEVITKTYEIIKKEEDLAKTHKNYLDFAKVYYPEIHLSDKEKEKRINQNLYEAAMIYYNPEKLEQYENVAYAANYHITYAEEDYLSILYLAYVTSKNQYYVGVTIDLKTGEKVSLKEFVSLEELYNFCLKTTTYYSFYWEGFLKQLFMKKEKEEIFEFLREEGTHYYDYYLKEDRIGLRVDDHICIEIPRILENRNETIKN